MEVRRGLGVLLIAGATAAACGCDDTPTPPEDPRPLSQPAPDFAHSITVRADRTFTLHNLVFVFEPPRADGLAGLSLTTRTPEADGSSLIFGTVKPVAGLADLVAVDIRFGGGGPTWLPGGSQIVTPAAIYKPRLAALRLTSLNEEEAKGTITGEFYRYAAPHPAMTRATVVEVKAEFLAKVVVR